MAQSARLSHVQHQSSLLYGIMWAVLAIVAAAYIGTLLYKPEILGGTGKQPVSNQESNKGVRSLSKAMARLKQLKQSVRNLENEITRLKAIDAVAARSIIRPKSPVSVNKLNRKPTPANVLPQDKAALKHKPLPTALLKIPAPLKPKTIAAARKTAAELAARFSDAADQNGNPLKQPVQIAALKNVKIVSSPVVTPTVKPATVIGEAVQNAKKKIFPTKSVKTLPIKIARATVKKTITAPPVDAFGKTAKIQTGSVNAPATISFGAPVVKRAAQRTKVAIRLSSGPSIAALRLNWLALKDRYGTTLRGMSPRYETLGSSNNRRYRLIAGPLNSAAAAVSLCDRLNESNIACTVSALSGKRL